MPTLSYEEEKIQRTREALRLCTREVRTFSKLGYCPSDYSSKVDWLLDQSTMKSYLRLGISIRVPSSALDYSNNPGGSMLYEDREIVHYLLELVYDYLFYVQPDRQKKIFLKLITSKAFWYLNSMQKHVLWLVYTQSLEQGPRVILSNSFIQQRLALADDINITQQYAGRVLNSLVDLKLVLLIDPGKKSGKKWDWRSRIVSLNHDYRE